MARAAKPIFSPSCGLTRTIAGPPLPLSTLAFIAEARCNREPPTAMGPRWRVTGLPFTRRRDENREQDQGDKPSRRPRRGRDDASHLADDQGEADLPLSRPAAPLFRPLDPEPRRDRRSGDDRRGP